MTGLRVLGIDPGTKSFDICGLENGHVFYEEVLKSSELAKNPELLVETTDKAMPLDVIAGPSGYGVELTRLRDLNPETLEDWYLTYILLLKRKDLENALEREDPGIMVYSAMTETALKMKQKNWPVLYLPGVINLPTVPEHRKLNNLDMGTVDKLCCCLLGIHDQSERLSVPYSDVSFILVEMGHGYNATLGVRKGRIVDGFGGTMSRMGFFTSGGMDLELVQIGELWEKSDVFTGGASAVSGESSPKKMIQKRKDDENCAIAWEAMIENVEKSVASMLVSVPDPREILISGRLTRISGVEEELIRRLKRFAPVRKVGWLKEAKCVKEAAQGSAIAADGLGGGVFSKLIERVKLKDAKGTALDYLHHPKGKRGGKKLKRKVPFKPNH